MVYCTPANVKVYVGTTVTDADLTEMIADADAEINAFFASRGGKSPDSTTAKQVSILLTRARVAERFHLTGENPTGYSSGDYSQSGSVDQLGQAKSLQDRAYKIMNDEAVRLRTVPQEQADVTRSDAVMPDFHLDQSDDPTFFTEDA